MINFAEAYEEGIKAAQKAEREKEEIDEIFQRLNQDMQKATDGKIVIKRKELDKELTESESPTNAKGSFVPNVWFKTSDWYIVASNPSESGKPGKSMRLAKWSQAKSGYPCRLNWGNGEYVLEDGEALENALADMLRDPSVGKACDS